MPRQTAAQRKQAEADAAAAAQTEDFGLTIGSASVGGLIPDAMATAIAAKLIEVQDTPQKVLTPLPKTHNKPDDVRMQLRKTMGAASEVLDTDGTPVRVISTSTYLNADGAKCIAFGWRKPTTGYVPNVVLGYGSAATVDTPQ